MIFKTNDNGQIKVGELRKMISDLKDDEKILFMFEDSESGIGYNALEVEYFPPETEDEIDEDETPIATIYITI